MTNVRVDVGARSELAAETSETPNPYGDPAVDYDLAAHLASTDVGSRLATDSLILAKSYFLGPAQWHRDIQRHGHAPASNIRPREPIYGAHRVLSADSSFRPSTSQSPNLRPSTTPPHLLASHSSTTTSILPSRTSLLLPLAHRHLVKAHTGSSCLILCAKTCSVARRHCIPLSRQRVLLPVRFPCSGPSADEIQISSCHGG